MTTSIETTLTASVANPVITAAIGPAKPIGIHPSAELFPLMKDSDFAMLVEDIAAHGLREPILVYQGLVLDGRNRLRACEVAGVDPRFVEWDGVGSPLAVVLSRNLHRRHLNEGQRSIIAARAKVMFEEEAAERERAHQFRQQKSGTAESLSTAETTAGANLRQPGRSNDQAAELLNVSARSVCTASRVLKSADEQVIAAVESGDVAVSDASAIADRPKDQQRQALAAVRQGRARTLRRAADQKFGAPSPLPQSAEASAKSARRQLRAEATRFVRQLDKLLLRLDALIAAFGANEHTDRMRRCLHHLVDLFRDFARQFLHADP